MARRELRVLVRQDRSIDPGWRPVQGDFYDAVLAALEFAGVPAVVIEQERQPTRGVRRMLRGTVTGRASCDATGSCEGCGGERRPDHCAICDACADCCTGHCDCSAVPCICRPDEAAPCLVCGNYAPEHDPGCMVGPECPEKEVVGR